ncbi:hypothetical protein MTR_4g032785 [Medicago truncatula]|uniref:Uncharacterized protein n=1 Tax=Medicago truncatula TaxID=3880 RepID=A0A072UTR2_MEDTR|nr:hypothetical protein MTR_4g032785 [Medicago truncatula]
MSVIMFDTKMITQRSIWARCNFGQYGKNGRDRRGSSNTTSKRYITGLSLHNLPEVYYWTFTAYQCKTSCSRLYMDA